MTNGFYRGQWNTVLYLFQKLTNGRISCLLSDGCVISMIMLMRSVVADKNSGEHKGGHQQFTARVQVNSSGDKATVSRARHQLFH